MRRLLIIFAIALLPSFALAAHGGGGHMGGGGGGHMGGGWGGGHIGAGWGGRSMAMVPGRMSGWHGVNWHGANWHHAPFFHHGRFVHRHNRFFFVGAPFFAAYGYGYDYCWRWVPTAWGPRRVWVCGDYY